MGKNPAQKIAAKAAKAKDETKKPAEHVEKVAKPKKAAAVVQTKRSELHCKIGNCKREYRAKGYCNVHYKKWRQGEFGVARFKTCKDLECRKPLALNRHGYCEDHFQNYYVKGVAVPVAAVAQATEKAEKTEKEKTEKVA